MTLDKLLSLAGAAAAILACALAIWLFATPLTGVTGTPGPILAATGAGAAALAGLILAVLGRGWLRFTLVVLTGLALILTAIAGWFLDSLLLVVLIVLAALLLFSAVRHARPGGAA